MLSSRSVMCACRRHLDSWQVLNCMHKSCIALTNALSGMQFDQDSIADNHRMRSKFIIPVSLVQKPFYNAAYGKCLHLRNDRAHLWLSESVKILRSLWHQIYVLILHSINCECAPLGQCIL